jgi:hypothetical protein
MKHFEVGLKEHGGSQKKDLIVSIKFAKKINDGEMTFQQVKKVINNPKSKKEALVDCQSESEIESEDKSDNIQKKINIDESYNESIDELLSSSDNYLQNGRRKLVKVKPYESLESHKLNSKLVKNSNDKDKVNVCNQSINSLFNKCKVNNISSDGVSDLSENDKIYDGQIHSKTQVPEHMNDDSHENVSKDDNSNENSYLDIENEGEDSCEKAKDLAIKKKKMKLTSLIEGLIFIKVNTPSSSGIKTIISKLKEISDFIDDLFYETGMYQVS